MSEENLIKFELDDGQTVMLDPQPGLHFTGVIYRFVKDIYKGYAKVEVIQNAMTIDHHKEIPDHILQERIDTHPFNHNRRLIIEP